MKTLLFILALTVYSGLVLSNEITITNSGFTFTPDSVSISTNDTVVFQIASIHDVVEVSEATWNANGNTPLPGGFTLPFGGGQLTALTTGLHYYVCSPHASLGMKGRIFVTSGAGIRTSGPSTGKVIIYPNPTSGKFSFRYQDPVLCGSTAQNLRLEIYNILGEKIIIQTNLQPQTVYEFDLTSFHDGIYFLYIVEGTKSSTIKIVKNNCWTHQAN